MAIARVKTGTAATTTGTGTITPTLPSGAVAGNIIIALIAVNTPTTPPTISSSGGATKQVENATGSAAGTAIFTKVAAGGETDIGAFTLSTGTRDMYGVLIEYSGMSGITAERTQNGGSGTAALVIPTGVTALAASAGALVLGIEANANTIQIATVARAAGDASTGGTVTKLAEANSGSATTAQRVTGRVSEVIITGAGVVGHQATLPTTARFYSAAIAAFTAAGATNATATPETVAAVGAVPAPTVIAVSPVAFPSFVAPDMSLYPS